MISISSGSGIRLAKSKDAMDRLKAKGTYRRGEYNAAWADYLESADGVANELIADNFHEFTEQGDT